MVLSPYPGHSKPLTGRPRNRGEIKYYYRVKQSYFEELVCNGAQGRTDSPGANQDAQSATVGIATGMWRVNRTTDTRIFSPQAYKPSSC